MDFAALKVFLTVVQEGSFSRASEKLGRTQPAVSLAVKRLETELGEALLNRSSRELILTDIGHAVTEFGRRLLNLEKSFGSQLEELRDLSAGRLVIGANESSTLYLLQHVSAFRRLYPKIKVRVQRCLSSRIPQQLLEGDLELGVISYEPLEAQLVSEVIYRDHLAFIVSPDHRLAARESVPIKELGIETFIAHNVVSPYRRRVLRTFQDHKVPLNMDVEMPTIEGIRKLVQRNQGVTFLPRMCVDHEIRQGALCEVKVPELKVERFVRLVHPRRRSLSRAATAFLELLKQRRKRSSEARSRGADG